MPEFIDFEARSFDSGEYACAQEARPLLEFGIEEYLAAFTVHDGKWTCFALNHKSSQKREGSRQHCR
jgi:hypothetical protein